jgi:integration host factor subunit beta
LLDDHLMLWQLPQKPSSQQRYTPTMLKSELVQKLAEQNTHLYPRDLEKVVNAILGTIADALAQGGRAEIRGFGSFSVKKRGARTGRNPRTGEAVAVSEKAVPVFKAGKEMRQRLNALPRQPKMRVEATATNISGFVDA